jgi:hypothetical protein
MKFIITHMIQPILSYQKLLFCILLNSIVLSQEPEKDTLALDFDLDIDAMFEQAVWEEIQEVTTVYYEVEKITAVAGVRGAEAEDEALALLYYRKSMKGLSKLDIQKALGKLIIKRQKMSDDDSDTQKIDGYIAHLKNKLKKV